MAAASVRIPIDVGFLSCLHCTRPYNLIRYPSYIYTPHSSSMADYLRKLKGKFSRSHSRSRPSINQSGPNATITIQGSYNDVGRDQHITNITNVTNIGGTLWIIQSKQNLTTWCIKQSMIWSVCFDSWCIFSDLCFDLIEPTYNKPP